ncbi:hypothetical protein [Ekhidna sp.]|uniref:hypothetical protein n=1 Tax=Ekhidna sp. TaxID=2608089 RepID=UPI003B5B37A8
MKVNPKVVSDQFDNEIVVVNLENGFYYSFKNSALNVWQMAIDGFSRDMIVGSFADLNENQKGQINQFLNHLIEESLIEEVEGRGSKTTSEFKFKDLTYAKFEDMSDLIMIDPIHDADEKKGWPHKAD